MPNLMRAPTLRARQRGFFDFSITELAIIFGVALVVLGPKKLPGLVAQIGRWVGRARHMARQFREQLETEVNSINAVKPIPRQVPPVNPATPGPEVAAAASSDTHTADTAATAVVDHPPAPEPAAAANATAPTHEPAQEMHPEAQIYFALNGSQPEVVTANPYAEVAAADSTSAAEQPQGTAAPAVEPKPETLSDPASVKVIFPHDHG
jgi:sec-independent protein translocase protein TatB